MRAGKTRCTENMNIAVSSFMSFELSSIKQTVLKAKRNKYSQKYVITD